MLAMHRFIVEPSDFLLSFAIIRSLSRYHFACSHHSSYFMPHTQNEKATRQLGGLFSRENSSNGGLESRQNFLPKSYERKNRGVKRFLRNKYLCFQYVTNIVNIPPQCSKLRQIALGTRVSRYF